jgi:hypothetical protein
MRFESLDRSLTMHTLRDGPHTDIQQPLLDQPIASEEREISYSLRPKNNDVLLNLSCVHVHVGM